MKEYLVHGDCIEGMQSLETGSFNLIIADPPYNLNKDFGAWKEYEKRDQWKDWTWQWLTEATRCLAETGNIFVYGIHRYQCFVQCMLYELGLEYRRQIIWYYENGFSGYSARTLSACYEPILWFSKSDQYVYHTIREPYKSQERLKHKVTKNGKVWTPHPDGRRAGDVWCFPTLAGRRFRDEKVNHPTQKSLALSSRIVEHFSNPDDTVLVPFVGSGSECVAAKRAGRGYVGFDLNGDYIELAKQRLIKEEDALQGHLI